MRRRHLRHLSIPIAAKQKFKCAICINLFGEAGWEIDHILALCNGGADDVHNLQALCHTCHANKSRQDMYELYRTRNTGVKISPYFDKYHPKYIRPLSYPGTIPKYIQKRLYK